MKDYKQKSIAMLFLSISCLSLVLCSCYCNRTAINDEIQNKEQLLMLVSKDDTINNFMKNDYIELKIRDSDTPQSHIECEITNNTSILICFGEFFDLFHNNNNQWVSISTEKGDFTAQLNCVEPYHSFQFDINLNDYFDHLAVGQYKLSKRILSEAGEVTIEAIFQLNDPIN